MRMPPLAQWTPGASVLTVTKVLLLMVMMPVLVPGGSVLVVAGLVIVPAVPSAANAANAAPSPPPPPPPPQALSKKDSISIGTKEYAARMTNPEKGARQIGLSLCALPRHSRTEIRAKRERFSRSLNGLFSLRQKKRELQDEAWPSS
jgi:hypothetical protein